MTPVTSSYSRSSSNITGRWTYDVFLSFRGEDTRKNFVDHLYTALEIRGIYTFKDDQRLSTGGPIPEQLLAAIEESRFAVVVFSENYADSAWCLDELVHIRDCRNEIRQIVIPVFYKVNPYVVRRQIMSFGEAFRRHESRYENEKIQRWKDTLFDVAGLSGFDVSNTANGHESECITKIVEEISSKCRPILNWYKEEILGFAICIVFHGHGGGCIDIQFDLIEESNPQYVPQTSIQKNSYWRYQTQSPIGSVWLGFISFKFFLLLFPEFQLDNWSTYMGTIGVSVSIEHYTDCKQLAIRPVYKKDVERVPATRISELVQNDPTGRPWLQHYLNDEEMDNVYPKADSHDGGFNPSSSTTAYLKERGRTHARLVFWV